MRGQVLGSEELCLEAMSLPESSFACFASDLRSAQCQRHPAIAVAAKIHLTSGIEAPIPVKNKGK